MFSRHLNKDLNISNDFMNLFSSKSKKEILEWILLVIKDYEVVQYQTVYLASVDLINSYLRNESTVSDARNLSFSIHRNAKIEKNDMQYYLRALGHMVATIHVKEHALKCLDYLIKFVYYQTKSNDQVVGERLRQYSLLMNQNLSQVK